MGRKRKAGSLPSPLLPSARGGVKALQQQHANKSKSPRTALGAGDGCRSIGTGNGGQARAHANCLRAETTVVAVDTAVDEAASVTWKNKRKKKKREGKEGRQTTASNDVPRAPPVPRENVLATSSATCGVTPEPTLIKTNGRDSANISPCAPQPPSIPMQEALVFSKKEMHTEVSSPRSIPPSTIARSHRQHELRGNESAAAAKGMAHKEPQRAQKPRAEAPNLRRNSAGNVACVLPKSPEKKRGEGMMTPSEVLAQLVPRAGWRLASCWSTTCNCNRFMNDYGEPAAGGLCGCGHSSSAHELVDVHKDGAGDSPTFHDYVSSGQNGAKANGGRLMGGGAGDLRRLFAAIRNARAVGACGLFQDSEGICGWGTGWFLSRLARGYLQQAREAIAKLDQALHDPPVVERCLSNAERLMSGNAASGMPSSLPLSTIYQVLGTSITSELDLAYWHVRYTAASRFNAGGVTADSPFHVVPPPEVYFVCLASHLPSIVDLCSFPGLENPALRVMLEDVFDLPVGVGQHLGSGLSRLETASIGAEIEFPVLSNPLLTVTQSAWLETAIAADAKSWVSHFPARFGQAEGTMRGSDPALPAPIRARCDAMRDWSARLLAFAVPNRRAVDACRRALRACGATASGIVEVGAGLGYWKWVLEGRGAENWRGRMGTESAGKGGAGGVHVLNSNNGGIAETVGLTVLAVDKDPAQVPTVPSRENLVVSGETREMGSKSERSRVGGQGTGVGSRRRRGKKGQARGGDSAGSSHTAPSMVCPVNEYHGGAPAWAVVDTGGPELLQSLNAKAFPVLLWCYPPPSIGGGNGACAVAACMGANALSRFLGNVLLYVGEVRGDTGSPQLEAMLEAGWDLVEAVDLPCFPSTANQLMVFVRKGKSLHNNAAALTTGASPHPVPLHRCTHCETSGAGRDRGQATQLRRCRLTRAVSYCSGKRCFSRDVKRWRANLEARHIYLPAGAAAGDLARSTERGLRGDAAQTVFGDNKLFKRLNSNLL